MEILQAKTRDMGVKAKKLRREGYITGSISGRDLEHSVSICILEKDAKQFMLRHHVGSKAEVSVDGTTYQTMIKSADFDTLNNRYTDMTFQKLVADEKIRGKAEIIFENEDKAQGYVTGNVSEVEYKAYPKDITDRIVLDVSQYPIGTEIRVADLDIAKNDKFEVLTPLDASVLHVAEHRHVKAEDAELLEEGEESTDASGEA